MHSILILGGLRACPSGNFLKNRCSENLRAFQSQNITKIHYEIRTKFPGGGGCANALTVPLKETLSVHIVYDIAAL